MTDKSDCCDVVTPHQQLAGKKNNPTIGYHKQDAVLPLAVR